MVLAHLTGDLAILDEVAPHIQGAWSFMETVPEALKQKVRDRLVEALKDYAATGRQPPSSIPEDTLQRMMSAGVGQTVPAAYIPLLVEETRLSPEDARAVRWRRDGVDARGFKVVIVGAGFSGLCAGVRLKEMGIPFEILEKNSDVGGTWLENRYPGCAVDTPNHFYSYSFNQNGPAIFPAATKSWPTSTRPPTSLTYARRSASALRSPAWRSTKSPNGGGLKPIRA